LVKNVVPLQWGNQDTGDPVIDELPANGHEKSGLQLVAQCLPHIKKGGIKYGS
jgi:hypothetical protein